MYRYMSCAMSRRCRRIAVGIGMIGFHLFCADGWLAWDKNCQARRNLEIRPGLLLAGGCVESKLPVFFYHKAYYSNGSY